MIKNIRTPIAKLLWLWITGKGQSTPAQMVEEIGVPRRTVMRAIAELKAGGFVIRVSAGLYCATGGTHGAMSGTRSAQRNNIKQNKTKEKKEILEKEEIRVRSTDRISDWIAFANQVGMPGCDKKMLEQINADAAEAVREGRVNRRWVHVANWVRKVFEAAGWEWTKCRTEKEKVVQELHRVRDAKRAAAAIAEKESGDTEPEIVIDGRVVRKCSHRGTGSMPTGDGLEKLRDALSGRKPKRTAKGA